MNRTAHVCKGYKLSQSLLILFPVGGGWNGTDYHSHFADVDPGAQRREIADLLRVLVLGPE